ncbi:hypothetical protein D3C81_1395910 [compost metagenome]
MDSIKIKVADNGYMVEFDDPAIVEANSKNPENWKDPETYRVYATQAALIEDLAALLPGLKMHEPDPNAEDTASFHKAFKSE